MPLPRVNADGVIRELVSFEVAMHGGCVTLVVRYDWPINHPLGLSPPRYVWFPLEVKLWTSVSCLSFGLVRCPWTRCRVD